MNKPERAYGHAAGFISFVLVLHIQPPPFNTRCGRDDSNRLFDNGCSGQSAESYLSELIAVSGRGLFYFSTSFALFVICRRGIYMAYKY